MKKILRMYNLSRRKKKIIIIIPDRLVEGRKNRELIEFIIRFIFSLLMKWNLDDIYGALYIYIYIYEAVESGPIIVGYRAITSS